MSYEIKITRSKTSNLPSLDFNNIPFGKIFTDHMFEVDYKDGEWVNPEIKPLTHLSVHPGNMAWHYGQAIFEGMKATIHDGTALLFRPEMHSVRFNKSAKRMCMPEVPEELFLKAVHTLVDMEKAWIPPAKGSALYIRPFMIATDETIGVKASDTYKFIIFVMPVGPYYSQPVNLLAQDEFVRAVAGGVGEAKTAGNYAASLYPATMAKKEGYDQVMWLDAIHRKYIQEVGTMNIFFVIDNEIITPALDGAILAGITRDSILTVFRDKGFQVSERPITIDEVVEAHKAGKLSEVFGTGTAAVVAQVAKIKYKDYVIELNQSAFHYSNIAKDTINSIRDKSMEDKFGWIVPAKAY
ncbi:MAG: branched-chain amino acid aminotransferase [Saprospiraceae bacterium]|nr:branched-chain amino acid aminotransferase [Saprospiraceae bacterium]